MKMGHFVFLLLLVLLGFWIGQAKPQLLMGYPQKLFG